MVLLPIRTIKDRVYTSTITISEFGNATLSEADEKANLSELPQTLKYSDISFVGNMMVDKNNLPLFADDNAEEGTFDVVRLKLNNKEVVIDENFSISYSVDANSLKTYATTHNSIQDTDCLARAMILLWETKVIERVRALLTESREHIDNFTMAATEVVI